MNLASIPVHLIHEETTDITESLDPKALRVEVDNIRFKGPMMLSGGLSRIDKNIAIGLCVEGTQTLCCSRCLENFDRQLVKDMVFTIELRGQMTLNLLPLLREEIVMEDPIRVLCKENCEGLCPDCGSNLNLSPCQCRTTG